MGTRLQYRTLAPVVFFAAIVCLIASGCSRKYWRDQADDLSYDILEHKQVDPRWELPRVNVMPDPRSRFYDPYDPDFAPLPPDDPASHSYMHWVYGMQGYKRWHEFGDVPAVENPDWLNPFGLSPEVVAANYGRPALLPEVNKLTLEEAIELSWIHSRDYQTQVENAYLNALQLTFNRFQFDLQYIGFTGRPGVDLDYVDVPTTSDALALTPSVGVSKLLPTGAQFIAELANNTLWLFSGGSVQDSTASTISYSLVQPLLANGGRRFVLEGLTQAERDVLYALRDLARYRMGFFTSTVAGGTTAGLTSGVPAPLQTVGALGTPISGGGYLGLLQQIQVIANQRYNIRQLKERLDRLHASSNLLPERIGEDLQELPEFPDGVEFPPPELADRIQYSNVTKRLYLRGTLTDAEERRLLSLSDDIDYRRAVTALAVRSVIEIEVINQQMSQLETQLATQCNGLRSSVVLLLDNIDRYKLFLGLPTDMPVSIDDSILKPFQLVDPRLTRLQDRLNTFVPDPPEVAAIHPDIEIIRRVAALWARINVRSIDQPALRALVDELSRLSADIRRDGIEVLEEDFRRWEEHQKNAPPKPIMDDCMVVYRDEGAESRLRDTLMADYADVDERLRVLKHKLAAGPLTQKQLEDELFKVTDVREDLLKTTQSLTVVQIYLRVDLIDLNPFQASLEEAVALGLENRMDLMNARAEVMDARRQVEVAANQLQALLNVVAAGDIRTQGNLAGNNNPFDFRGSQSSIRAGVQFTSPVQLVQQRNVYRAALIGLQRARRNYMRIEDQVKLEIRIAWRQLNVLKQNFETARENVRVATAQMDIAVEQSSAPVTAPAAGAATQGTAQGLNILNALQAVLNAQNQLIQIWVNFETNRLNIHNFMGTMEVDPYGFWTDEYYQRRAQAARAGQTLVELPPDSSLVFPSPSAPQEPRNDPAVPSIEELPSPAADSPAAPQSTGGPRRPRDRLQLVKAEEWPARERAGAKPTEPMQPAAGRDRQGARDSAGAGGGGRRGGGLAAKLFSRPRAADRPDR
ncbi:MAG: TolC family protein [Planctomycetaceae bacterium]